MKLLIIRAMLAKADVLLLDEVRLTYHAVCLYNPMYVYQKTIRLMIVLYFIPADESFGCQLSGLADSVHPCAEGPDLPHVIPTTITGLNLT